MEFKLWDQAPQTIAKFSILKPILAIHHLLLLTEHFSSWPQHPHKLLTRSISFKGKTLNTYHAVLNKELLERKLCNTVVEVKFKCCGFVLFVTSSAFCLWRSWHQSRCLQEKQQEASLGRQLNSLLKRNGKALVSAFIPRWKDVSAQLLQDDQRLANSSSMCNANTLLLIAAPPSWKLKIYGTSLPQVQRALQT